MNVEHMENMRSWVILKSIPSSPLPSSMFTVELLLQTCLPFRYKALLTYNLRANSASWVFVEMSFPFRARKQCVEQMKKIQFESCLKVTTPQPYTAVRSKYEENWHIEWFGRFPHCPLENITFNIWTNVASWVMFTMSSSHLLKQYVEYTPPLTIST